MSDYSDLADFRYGPDDIVRIHASLADANGVSAGFDRMQLSSVGKWILDHLVAGKVVTIARIERQEVRGPRYG